MDLKWELEREVHTGDWEVKEQVPQKGRGFGRKIWMFLYYNEEFDSRSLVLAHQDWLVTDSINNQASMLQCFKNKWSSITFVNVSMQLVSLLVSIPLIFKDSTWKIDTMVMAY